MSMPWERSELVNWDIVGMNHYRKFGRKWLYVSMTRGHECITAEGDDETGVWDVLSRQAAALSAAAQPMGVPKALMACMKWLPASDVSNRYCWTDEQAQLIWDVVKWARSQPPAAPVGEWVTKAREIVKRTPNEMDIVNELWAPLPWQRRVLADAASLCRTIASHGAEAAK